MENYLDKDYDLYGEDFIIDAFIEHKRDFLIKNLDTILDKEDFLNNEGFLIDIYLKITNHIKAFEITELKNNIIDKNCYLNNKNDI